MKSIKFLLIAVLVFVGFGANAQWGSNGIHTYTTLGGYVGIGTGSSFTPTENLHINTPSATANIALESSYTGSGSQVIGRYRIRNTGTGDLYYIGLRTTNGVREAIQSVKNGLTGDWLEFLYVGIDTRKYEIRSGILDAEFKNAGNVLFNNAGSIGVGTSTIPAGYKLAVDGKIICTELLVELTSSWPDYVFNDDYRLKPLSEVEQFINDNGHLPGVPSAQEVDENGLSIGEMNKKLMEKVEELTLYVIQLQKEVDSLKK